MRGFHPACSVPRRQRLRRRRTQNGRTLVAAVRTFHALRRTPSPPPRSPCGLSRCAHSHSTTNPAFSLHHEAPGGLHICSLPTHDEPCRLPLRSASRPLHNSSLATHDEPCLVPLRSAWRGDEGPPRLRDEGRHGARMGGSRSRPRRACLSQPFSGTRVSPTFRPVTPGAAGGVVAGEERPPPDPGPFHAEEEVGNVSFWPFWLRKSALPGSGHFRS